MFAERGVAGTSLDDLAAQLGVTKQTILYHFKSKNGLLVEVLGLAAAELVATLEEAAAVSQPGRAQVDEIARAAFALAVRRPDLVGLLREVSRLDQAHVTSVLAVLQPVVDDALHALDSGMDSGLFRRSDPRLILLSTYSLVTGVVADPVALAAVGMQLDVRAAVQLRSAVLDFLHTSLDPLHESDTQ